MATPPERPPSRWGSVAAVAVLALGAAIALALSPAHIQGDGWEYFQTLASLAAHGSPDFRPGDADAALAVYPPGHSGRELGFVPGEPEGWLPARDGRVYTIHFWAYPLSAVPAKWGLRLFGGNEWAALHVANLLWLLLGVSAILLLSRRPPAERWAFALLACSPQLVGYVWYTGAELYSWSLLTAALVAVGNERYAVSGLLVGLSALQNPASLAMGGLPFTAALVARRWRSAAGCALGGAVGFLPVLLCYLHYGKPSLLSGYADPTLISWGRTASLLFDLNQGLLAHLPVLLVAVPVAAAVAAARREWRPLAALLFWLPLFLFAQVQINWNSAAWGVMRYWVWMVPPLAWVAATTLRGRWQWLAALGALVGHIGVMAFDPPDGEYIRQRRLAEWVLTHYPEWYSPDPEIFAERQKGEDGWDGRDRYAMPVAFATPGGTVTKLLADRATRQAVLTQFDVTPAYQPTLLAELDADRPVYVHPPHGAVRLRPQTPNEKR